MSDRSGDKGARTLPRVVGANERTGLSRLLGEPTWVVCALTTSVALSEKLSHKPVASAATAATNAIAMKATSSAYSTIPAPRWSVKLSQIRQIVCGIVSSVAFATHRWRLAVRLFRSDQWPTAPCPATTRLESRAPARPVDPAQLLGVLGFIAVNPFLVRPVAVDPTAERTVLAVLSFRFGVF